MKTAAIWTIWTFLFSIVADPSQGFVPGNRNIIWIPCLLLIFQYLINVCFNFNDVYFKFCLFQIIFMFLKMLSKNGDQGSELHQSFWTWYHIVRKPEIDPKHSLQYTNLILLSALFFFSFHSRLIVTFSKSVDSLPEYGTHLGNSLKIGYHDVCEPI
jgi:hypothetical protein